MDGVAEVERCEARLRSAMVARDVATLSMLIDPALVFTGPDGSVLTRQQDLAAHAEGLLKLSRLDLSDTRYTVIGDMVLVTTKATLVGRFADAVIDGLYAYTRLWRATGSGWAVVAGQAARIG